MGWRAEQAYGEARMNIVSTSKKKKRKKGKRGFSEAREIARQLSGPVTVTRFSKQEYVPQAKAKAPRLPYVDTNAPDFLSSYSWRALRMQALKLHGAVCMCCGDNPKNGAVMNVDHIKPRRTHPELALRLDNLQILCHACNHGKGNWDDTDWRDAGPESEEGLEEYSLTAVHDFLRTL